MTKKLNLREGVTLMELLLVILIISVLAGLVLPQFKGKSDEARMAAAQADIESNIAMALDMYELDNGEYPSNLEALLRTPVPEPQNWNGPYLKRAPKDPWRNKYNYRHPGQKNQQTYDLWSNGKDGTEGGGDDIDNWSDTEEQ